MVAAQHRVTRTTRPVDALAAGLVLACLLGVVWLTLVEGGRMRNELGQLTQFLQQAEQDQRVLLGALEAQRSLVRNRQEDLARAGQLPPHPPAEAFFQMLTPLVSDFQLRVVRHNPLPSRPYPSLLESRYAFDVVGPWEGLVQFFRAVEATDFWADVSYLQLERGTVSVSEQAAVGQRVAAMTFSLFSAPVSQVPARPGGT